MNNSPLSKTVLPVFIGEVLVAALTALGWFALSFAFEKIVFSYRVVTGAALGAAVMILNFLALAYRTGKIVDEAMAERGTGEMTEEEIAAFTEKHNLRLRAAMTRSQIIRDLCMVAVLVGAFLLPWFEGVASLFPLVAFRPILTVTSLVQGRRSHGES